MNTHLAKEVANVIREKWKGRNLDSKEVYQDLIARNVEVPSEDMNIILGNFKKAGVINGLEYMNSTGVAQHGAMVIGRVNLELLDQLDFD
jgi:hypothetical protein